MREITAEEVEFWDAHNDARNDNRYRKIEDCNEITDTFDIRQDKQEVLSSVMEAKLNILIAILGAIGIAILPVCIKFLLGE